uniref:Uncharacterized protein n=1 Tax=Setaria italica TaxID=4555 RepID=K3Y469_SETIT
MTTYKAAGKSVKRVGSRKASAAAQKARALRRAVGRKRSDAASSKEETVQKTSRAERHQ